MGSLDNFADRRDHLRRQLRPPGIHQQDALLAGLHQNVGAIAHQQIHVALNLRDLDLRRRRRNRQHAIFRNRARPDSFHCRAIFGIHRLRAAEHCIFRKLIAIGKLPQEWILARKIAGHRAIRPAGDFLRRAGNDKPTTRRWHAD